MWCSTTASRRCSAIPRCWCCERPWIRAGSSAYRERAPSRTAKDPCRSQDTLRGRAASLAWRGHSSHRLRLPGSRDRSPLFPSRRRELPTHANRREARGRCRECRTTSARPILGRLCRRPDRSGKTPDVHSRRSVRTPAGLLAGNVAPSHRFLGCPIARTMHTNANAGRLEGASCVSLPARTALARNLSRECARDTSRQPHLYRWTLGIR